MTGFQAEHREKKIKRKRKEEKQRPGTYDNFSIFNTEKMMPNK